VGIAPDVILGAILYRGRSAGTIQINRTGDEDRVLSRLKKQGIPIKSTYAATGSKR